MTTHSFRDASDRRAYEGLSEAIAPLPLVERVRAIRDAIDGRLVFTTSFGLEDQALTHAIATSGIEADIVTLDTGRLFDETLEAWAETEFRYNRSIRAFTPESEDVEELLARDGAMGFRRSIEARKACCEIRKVHPLARSLAGAAGWFTGLRAGQSAARAATAFVEIDETYGLLKISPLADWTREQVADLVNREGVPYNALHDRGFPSIGCAPCTRAVRVGESERAGRWWWEGEDKKECGLHSRIPHAASIVADQAA